MTLRIELAVTIVVVLSMACSVGAEGLTLADLREEAILNATIPGLSAKRIADKRSGSKPMITQLMHVSGSWEVASVKLAEAVQAHDWTVESIKCVGSGNDVIAKKRIEGQWVLLESGAGTRAAGIILRLDPSQQPPKPLSLDWRCPAALIASVS